MICLINVEKLLQMHYNVPNGNIKLGGELSSINYIEIEIDDELINELINHFSKEKFNYNYLLKLK